MRFFEIVVSGAALISSAFAATIDTYPTSGVVAGQTYTVTYSPKDQQVTFVLRKGLSTNLDTVGTLGTATGGSFTWTVAKDLPNAPNYALEIQSTGAPNYSGQFPLTGGSDVVSSASAALSSASAAASSARASASSVVASLSARVSSIAASATILPSAGANSTVSLPTLSKTASGTTKPTASSSGGSPPQSTGAAASLSSSPLALVFGAIAAIAYLY